jgi:hypothetical protein
MYIYLDMDTVINIDTKHMHIYWQYMISMMGRVRFSQNPNFPLNFG